jgi:pimeloyl-ACP methyl ester carboxylesterase
VTTIKHVSRRTIRDSEDPRPLSSQKSKRILTVTRALFLSASVLCGTDLQGQVTFSAHHSKTDVEGLVVEMRDQAPDAGGPAPHRPLLDRPMVPNDLFSIRKYNAIKISPDEQLVAVEIGEWHRGVSSMDSEGGTTKDHRTEIWVAYRNGPKRGSLTHDRASQRSQWDPVWSPNSQRLAFLADDREGSAYIEVWDRISGRLRRLRTSGIDLSAFISETRSFRLDGNQLFWLDNTHLLAAVLPAGLRLPFFDGNSISSTITRAGIRAAAGGVKATPIVASSPPRPRDMRDFPQEQLVIVDTNTGESTVVGYLPVLSRRRYIVISKNREWAAIVADVPPAAIDPQSPMSPRQLTWSKLGVIPLRDHSGGVRWVDGFQPALVGGFNPTIAWQGGEASFFIVGQEIGTGGPPYLATVDAPSATWHSLAVLDEHRLGSDERMEILDIAGLEDGRVAVRVHHPRANADALRYSWWVVSGERATQLAKEEETLLKDRGRSSANVAVKFETSETGRLYETDASGRESTIFPDLNPQLAEIEAPRSMNFDYTSLRGETLQANLLLPHGYVQGKRYPTVVWVYAGEIRSGDEKPPRRDDDIFLNPLLLAGHGFAVLRPSMPITPMGVPGDPMLHLNEGVDPAIDKAVELGIVDPTRLAVAGHSYGGYSVFGLLTETHRYRAGIAMMGISDLTTMYSEFFPEGRYTDPEGAASLGPWLAECGHLRMGVPPWVDAERYVRNSPLFAADKIETPILIISGDLDVLVSQSDEMFTALHRQAKRADYVKYLGEEHGLESPANIVDMWQRVFAWLDTYVKSDPAEVQH